MNRANFCWADSLTDEQVLAKVHANFFLASTNRHVPEFEALYQQLISTYRVRARFEYLGYNGQWIWANGQRLVWRPNKRAYLELGEDVLMCAGILNSRGGGTNQYPSIAYPGAWCELEFLSYGPPVVNELHGWSIHVLSFEPLS